MDIKNQTDKILCLILNNLNFLCSQVHRVQALQYQGALGWIHLPRGKVQNPMYVFSLLRNVSKLMLNQLMWGSSVSRRHRGHFTRILNSVDSFSQVAFQTRSLPLWTAAKHQPKRPGQLTGKTTRTRNALFPPAVSSISHPLSPAAQRALKILRIFEI